MTPPRDQAFTVLRAEAAQAAIFFDALTAQHHELTQRIEHLRSLNRAHHAAALGEQVQELHRLTTRLQHRFGAYWATPTART